MKNKTSRQKKDTSMQQLAELGALFPQGTAGHAMITDIPVYRQDAIVREVRKDFIDNAKQYKTVNYLYIVTPKLQIKGVVSIRELLHADLNKKIGKIMVKHIVTVNPMDTVPQVALVALQNNLKMVPIVDHKNRLVGAFSTDQLLEILNKEFSNDLLRLSGVSVPRKHFKFDSLKIVGSRLPWMMIGMFGGILTGSIIGIFRSSIEAVILLAIFIPVIMSTGATSANQSAMIFIRNLLHGDIEHWTKYIINEIKVSAILAALLSIIIYFVLLIWPADSILAATVSISLFLTVVVSGLIGVITPMVLNKSNFDPAIGAGPFLTIIKDIIAMSIYFSVATILLGLLR